MSLEKKVLSIVSEITKVSISNLNQNSCLGNPSTWDSMAHTNLILMLEEAFDVSFEFDELDNVITIKAIIKSLKEKNVMIQEQLALLLLLALYLHLLTLLPYLHMGFLLLTGLLMTLMATLLLVG